MAIVAQPVDEGGDIAAVLAGSVMGAAVGLELGDEHFERLLDFHGERS